MAKIERRKVSNKAKKNALKTDSNKKWWTKKKIIISSIIAGVAVICAIVGTILYFVLSDDDDDTTYDYFVSTENQSGDTVEFKKGTYRGLQMLVSSENSLFEEYVIVFTYNSTCFYPDQSDDEDNYNKIHDEILLKMANLQTDINNAKEADSTLQLDLYIVDTNVGENASIYMNSVFFGDSALDEDSTDDTSTTISILLIKDGELVTKFDYAETESEEVKSKTIFSMDSSIVNSTAISNLSLYVQTQLK